MKIKIKRPKKSKIKIRLRRINLPKRGNRIAKSKSKK